MVIGLKCFLQITISTNFKVFVCTRKLNISWIMLEILVCDEKTVQYRIFYCNLYFKHIEKTWPNTIIIVLWKKISPQTISHPTFSNTEMIMPVCVCRIKSRKNWSLISTSLQLLFVGPLFKTPLNTTYYTRNYEWFSVNITQENWFGFLLRLLHIGHQISLY